MALHLHSKLSGCAVVIERGVTATPSGANNWYDVYINGELIQRVPFT